MALRGGDSSETDEFNPESNYGLPSGVSAKRLGHNVAAALFQTGVRVDDLKTPFATPDKVWIPLFGHQGIVWFPLDSLPGFVDAVDRLLCLDNRAGIAYKLYLVDRPSAKLNNQKSFTVSCKGVGDFSGDHQGLSWVVDSLRKAAKQGSDAVWAYSMSLFICGPDESIPVENGLQIYEPKADAKGPERVMRLALEWEDAEGLNRPDIAYIRMPVNPSSTPHFNNIFEPWLAQACRVLAAGRIPGRPGRPPIPDAVIGLAGQDGGTYGGLSFPHWKELIAAWEREPGAVISLLARTPSVRQKDKFRTYRDRFQIFVPGYHPDSSNARGGGRQPHHILFSEISRDKVVKERLAGIVREAVGDAEALGKLKAIEVYLPGDNFLTDTDEPTDLVLTVAKGTAAGDDGLAEIVKRLSHYPKWLEEKRGTINFGNKRLSGLTLFPVFITLRPVFERYSLHKTIRLGAVGTEWDPNSTNLAEFRTLVEKMYASATNKGSGKKAAVKTKPIYECITVTQTLPKARAPAVDRPDFVISKTTTEQEWREMRKYIVMPQVTIKLEAAANVLPVYVPSRKPQGAAMVDKETLKLRPWGYRDIYQTPAAILYKALGSDSTQYPPQPRHKDFQMWERDGGPSLPTLQPWDDQSKPLVMFTDKGKTTSGDDGDGNAAKKNPPAKATAKKIPAKAATKKTLPMSGAHKKTASDTKNVALPVTPIEKATKTALPTPPATAAVRDKRKRLAETLLDVTDGGTRQKKMSGKRRQLTEELTEETDGDARSRVSDKRRRLAEALHGDSNDDTPGVTLGTPDEDLVTEGDTAAPDPDGSGRRRSTRRVQIIEGGKIIEDSAVPEHDNFEQPDGEPMDEREEEESEREPSPELAFSQSPGYHYPPPPDGPSATEKARRLRERSYAHPLSVHDDNAIPIHAPPLEPILRIAGDNMPAVSLGVLTPTEARRLQKDFYEMRNLTLQRTLNCPYPGCGFVYQVNHALLMHMHLRQAHAAEKCNFCDEPLFQHWPSEQRYQHYVQNHAKLLAQLQTAGIKIPDPKAARSVPLPRPTWKTQAPAPAPTGAGGVHGDGDAEADANEAGLREDDAAREATWNFCARCGRNHTVLNASADRAHHDAVCYTPAIVMEPAWTACELCGERIPTNNPKSHTEHKRTPFKGPFCKTCALPLGSFERPYLAKHKAFCEKIVSGHNPLRYCPWDGLSLASAGLDAAFAHVRDCKHKPSPEALGPYDPRDRTREPYIEAAGRDSLVAQAAAARAKAAAAKSSSSTRTTKAAETAEAAAAASGLVTAKRARAEDFFGDDEELDADEMPTKRAKGRGAKRYVFSWHHDASVPSLL